MLNLTIIKNEPLIMKPSHPILSAIVAMSENRVIGVNNQLPWHLPADLKHFKTLTTGHPIVMGRKTFESIGKPLPNRTNIILTRDPTYLATGCLVVTSIAEALNLSAVKQTNEIFIIGGATIYKQLLPQINKLYLTLVHTTIVGDTYFPPIEMSEWIEEAREEHAADEVNRFDYSFVTLRKHIT